MNTQNTTVKPTPVQIESASQTLRAAGFLLVEPFQAPDVYCELSRDDLSLGVVLDTETTGKDNEKDRVIELGMVFFEFDAATGQVYRIVDVFDELQDPGIAIPPEATAVNGITDEMVKGRSIDAEAVADRVLYCDLVIAHNAGFDRNLCEKEWPIFKSKAWACSFRQIPWQTGSAKLDYIAFKRGFHYEAHRAEMDCRVLLHVLQAPLEGTEQTTLGALLATYRTREMRVWAVDTPFAVKDRLKERGYQWRDGTAGTEKAWFCMVSEADLDAELAWLKANAYGNKTAAVVVDTVDAFSRFSTRRVGTERKYL